MLMESIGDVRDCSLVREAQRGNQAAFAKLVHTYDRTVLRLALRLTGSQSDAQDIHQEAFLKVYKKLDEHILRALQRLTPRERLVFDLRHFEGLKLQNVSEILNASEGSIKMTFFRATRKLRLQLGKYTKRHRSSVKQYVYLHKAGCL
jgi:DNA-directed RNA polymerase specialized sigma24 family protein